ncbi:MAG: hypothetical protein L0Y74_02225 [candidate division Zixibacteria bacterium]|nr:hypothetical protein [candidate division Zixibacteria bacterium]
MLSNGAVRGFSEKWLATVTEPRVQKDERGYFIFSISENSQVHFDDFYKFLEETEKKCLVELGIVNFKLNRTPPTHQEAVSYYVARRIVIEQLLKNIYSFYSDNINLGVIMTPWCFGTVILEKLEIYKGKLTRGEAIDPILPEFPYYVFCYLEEIYQKTLLEIFGFPPQAFSVRWQYTELLKRYSQVLSNVNSSLQNILHMARPGGEKQA